MTNYPPPLLPNGASHKLHVVPGAESLLVIFSATGKANGKFDFSRIAPSLPVTTLLFNDPENGWYQNGVPGVGKSVAEVADRVGDLARSLGASRIYTMGTSMGGYGALLYGSRLNARMLAFAPDTKLRAAHTYSRKMMPARVRSVHPDLIPILRETQGHAQVVCGELDARDMWHVARLRGIETVSMASMPGVGHAIPRALQKQGELEEVIAGFLADQPLDRTLFTGMALTVSGLSNILWKAYQCYNGGERDEALTLALSALERHPSSDCARVLLMRSYVALGQPKKALQISRGLSDLAWQDEDIAVLAGQVGRKTRNPDLAVAALNALAQKYPDNTRILYELGMGLIGAGDRAGGLVALERAAQLRPDVENYTRQLMKHRQN